MNYPAFAPLPALTDAALKSLVLLAVAIVATALLRRCSAAARHLVWCAALVGALLLPLLSLALPQWQVSFLPRWPAWAQTPAAAPAPHVGEVPSPHEVATTPAAESAPGGRSLSWHRRPTPHPPAHGAGRPQPAWPCLSKTKAGSVSYLLAPCFFRSG